MAGAGARAGNADGMRPADSTAAVVPVSEGTREGGGAAGTASGPGDIAHVTPSPFSCLPSAVPLGIQSEPDRSVRGVMAQESAVARPLTSSSSSSSTGVGLAPGSPPRRVLLRSSSTPAQVDTAAVVEPRAGGWLEEGLRVVQEAQGAGSGDEGAPRGDRVCTVAEVVEEGEEGGAGEEGAEAVGEEEEVDEGEEGGAAVEMVTDADATGLSEAFERLPEGGEQRQRPQQQEQWQGEQLPALGDAAAACRMGAAQDAPVSPLHEEASAVSSVAPQAPAAHATSQAPIPSANAASQPLNPNVAFQQPAPNATHQGPAPSAGAAPQALPVNATFPAPSHSAGAATRQPAPSTAAAGPSPSSPQTAGWDWVPALELPAAAAAGAGTGAGSRPSLAGRQQQPKQQQLKQRLAQGLWQPEPWVLKVRHDGAKELL